MTLFNTSMPKAPAPVHDKSVSLLGRMQRYLECTEVFNIMQTPIPRGYIVSYISVPTDPRRIVGPTSDMNVQCKRQYVGVLEAELPAAADANSPTAAIARHDGGPVYVAMQAGILNMHVGDSVWATSDIPGGYGQLISTISSRDPIYIGMISQLDNYNPMAPSGTTGVICIVKHGGPTPDLP